MVRIPPANWDAVSLVVRSINHQGIDGEMKRVDICSYPVYLVRSMQEDNNIIGDDSHECG